MPLSLVKEPTPDGSAMGLLLLLLTRSTGCVRAAPFECNAGTNESNLILLDWLNISA